MSTRSIWMTAPLPGYEAELPEEARPDACIVGAGIAGLTTALALVEAGLDVLVLALLEWFRCAELTSDRAALLCVQDLEPARDVFMKLAGGTTRLAAEMDREEFLAQVRAYEDVDRSTLDRAYKILLTIGRTHPFAMQRAKELELWFGAGYPELMANHAAPSAQP